MTYPPMPEGVVWPSERVLKREGVPEATVRRVVVDSSRAMSRAPGAILATLAGTSGVAGLVDALGINLSGIDLESLVAGIPKGVMFIMAAVGWAIVIAVREARSARREQFQATLRVELKTDQAQADIARLLAHMDAAEASDG